MEECDRASLVLSYADLDPKCDASASRFMAAEAQGNTSLAIPLASAKAKCREHRESAWAVYLRCGPCTCVVVAMWPTRHGVPFRLSIPVEDAWIRDANC